MMPLRAFTGGPPRLRPHWPIRPLRCPQMRGRSSRLGAAWRRSRVNPHARHGRIVERDPALVLLARYRGEPRLVVEIPAYGTLEPRLESLCRRPAKLAADLGRVDRITAIMPRAVLDECDLPHVIGPWLELAENTAQRTHDLEIGLFGATADVVGLTGSAALEHGADRCAVIADVEPVADLQTVAVDRQWLSGNRVVDHERNQLFRKLPRPIVVRAVRGERRQPVGVMVGTNQMIRARFRRSVGAVRRIRCGFRKWWIVGPERTVDLVGRHMQKPEARALGLVERAPVAAHNVEQRERADQVGGDEICRSVDRAVDMALGGKVEDRARPVLRKQRLDQGPVTDL